MELSSSTLSLAEATSGTYTLALNTAPSVNVTVSVASGDTSAVTAAPASLTYTASTWNTAQMVTATSAADDADGVDAEVTVGHAVASSDTRYTYVASALRVGENVTVTIEDDDAPGLVVSAAAAGLAVEEGASGTYRVRLNTQSGGAVTVGIADTASNADVSVGPSALTFTGGTTGNWATAQAVTVSAAADDTARLAHTVTGSGDTTNYPTTLAAVNVAVTVADADAAGVTVSATALALTETGLGSGTYTVMLDTEPTAPVTVVVASSKVTAAPGTLTFSETTWNTAQAVTAVADADAVDERVTVTHTLTGAAEYAGSTGPPVVAGVTVNAVTVTVEDDEEQGLTLDPTSVTGAEDGEETYTAVLTSQPLAPVVVRIGSDNPDVDTQPGLLQYTTSNWETAQTVTAAADSNTVPGTASISHTVGGYSAGTNDDRLVTVDEIEDKMPTLGSVAAQTYWVGHAMNVRLPGAAGGDPPLRYTLEPAELPAGLTYTPPAATELTGGRIVGTPAAVHAAATYTLTATDADAATLVFSVEVGAAGVIFPPAGTTVYRIGERELTVTRARGTLAVGLSYTPPTGEEPHGGTLSGTRPRRSRLAPTR